MTGAALLAAALCFAGNKYQDDVQFLLDRLEAGAGHFFAAKGVDWKAVRTRFTAESAKVKDDVDHVLMCERLIACLKDGHAEILESKVEIPPDRRPPEPKGIGLSIAPGAGPRAPDLIADCYGPAADAGLVAGSIVRKIDGKPTAKWLAERAEALAVTEGFSTQQAAIYAAAHLGLAGPPGTRFEVECVAPNGDVMKRALVCAKGGGNGVPIGPVFPPKDAVAFGRQRCGKSAKGFGWIHLRDVPQDLPSQLDELLAKLDGVKGLALDLRANGGGGTDHDAVFSRFLRAGETFAGRKGADAGRHFDGPVVVIVDAGTRSAAETICGMLKETGRAFVIGPSATAGMSGSKETIAVPSGLFSVRFVVKSHRVGVDSGADIEGVGVAPHRLVPYDAKSLVARVDPLIAAAEEILERGAPANVIRYAAPDRR